MSPLSPVTADPTEWEEPGTGSISESEGSWPGRENGLLEGAERRTRLGVPLAGGEGVMTLSDDLGWVGWLRV